MGGSAKGGGGNSSSQALEDISKKLFAETTPLRNTLVNQFMEALTTGGVGARIPIINKAVEASKQATSKSLTDLDQRLALMGLAGSPFGENIRQSTQTQGDLASARIPGDYVSQMLGLIPNFVTGQGTTVVTGLGNAGQIQAQTQANAMAPWMRLIPSFSFTQGKLW